MVTILTACDPGDLVSLNNVRQEVVPRGIERRKGWEDLSNPSRLSFLLEGFIDLF